MKRLALSGLAVLFLLVCAHVAGAEVISIGKKRIEYQLPAGYVLVESKVYQEVLNLVRSALPSNITMGNIYVEKQADEAFQRTGMIEQYLFLAYLNEMKDSELKVADFKGLQDYLLANHGSLFSGVKDKANQAIAEATDGEIQVSGVQSMGCFGISETAISLLASQQVSYPATVVDLVAVSSYILIEDRLLLVNQYKIINDQTDIAWFRDESQKVLQSMQLIK